MKGGTREELEARLEELKERLFDHDRAVIDRVGLSGKPSAQEKKARSGLIREINRTRRAIYRLAQGGPPVVVRFKVSGEEYRLLEEEAREEGLPLGEYLRRKVLDRL